MEEFHTLILYISPQARMSGTHIVKRWAVIGCGGEDSNLRPLAYEASELTTAPPRYKLVPHERIELPSEDYKAPVLPLY